MSYLNKISFERILLFCMAAAIASADPGNYNQQGLKLVGSGAVGVAEQGFSVALSADGNTALIGGPMDNSQIGAAWAFTRSNGVWTQQGLKLAGATTPGDKSQQGFSVALSADGNTAAVGAPGSDGDTGAVWVYTRLGGVWGPGIKLSPPFEREEYGYSVAISADGNTLVTADFSVIEPCVFTRSNGVWNTPPTCLYDGVDGEAPAFVTISGDGKTLAKSTGIAPGNYFLWATYSLVNGFWTKDNPVYGRMVSSGILSPGVSLSTDGNTLLSGGFFFHRSNGVWSIEAEGPSPLVAPDEAAGPFVLSADNGTIIQGYGYPSATDSPHSPGGRVAVFSPTPHQFVWSFYRDYTASGDAAGATQGSSVAVSANGNTLLDGSPCFDLSCPGGAWVFASPQLSTSLAHAGNFTRGETGATYTITVKNVGDRDVNAGSASTMDVVDTLPSGLTATGMFGMGWSCDITTLTCSRDDGLGAGDSFAPITVVVNVAANAPSSVTNAATAKGGGSTWGNASDVTTILP